MVIFELPFATPSMNDMLTKHWIVAGKKRYQRAVCESIKYGNGSMLRDHAKQMPFEKCEIEIFRYGLRPLDKDNLEGGVKCLIDVLKPVSDGNRYGLGIIVDDSMSVIVKQSVTQVIGKPRTILRIFA